MVPDPQPPAPVTRFEDPFPHDSSWEPASSCRGAAKRAAANGTSTGSEPASARWSHGRTFGPPGRHAPPHPEPDGGVGTDTWKTVDRDSPLWRLRACHSQSKVSLFNKDHFLLNYGSASKSTSKNCKRLISALWRQTRFMRMSTQLVSQACAKLNNKQYSKYNLLLPALEGAPYMQKVPVIQLGSVSENLSSLLWYKLNCSFSLTCWEHFLPLILSFQAVSLLTNNLTILFFFLHGPHLYLH